MVLALLAFFVASVVCFIVALCNGPSRSRYQEYQELYGGYQRFPGYEAEPFECEDRSPDYWDRIDEARENAFLNAVPISLPRNKNLTRSNAINLTSKEKTCEQQRNPFLRSKWSRGGGSATL
jgi:hypothetical protein